MSPHCPGCDGDGSRREFLRQAAAALVGVAGAVRVGPARLASLPIAFAPGRPTDAEEAAYPIPAEDGATIDKTREVILVRYEKAVYAFSLSCPHQKTPLRWQDEAQRFQCPKHKSRFQPDGSFIDGRATRNIDRYGIRREGDEVGFPSTSSTVRTRTGRRGLPLWSRSRAAGAARAWGLALAAGLTPGAAAAQADSAVAPVSANRMGVTDQLYTGWKYFQVYCSRCHGDDALGSMAAPDLTYSVSEEGGVSADSFAVVVRQGATDSTAPDRRMRGFEDLLDQSLIDALFAYVRARSDSSLPPGRPRRAPTSQ